MGNAVDRSTRCRSMGQQALPWAGLILVGLFVAALLALIGEAPARAIPIVSLKDGEISAAIDRSLVRDAMVPHERIRISTRDGMVTLSGTVPNLMAKDRAVRHAESIKGVRVVIDRLAVETVNRSDEELVQKVQEALRRDPATGSLHVKVSAEEGRITLAGSTPSWAEKQLATEAAKSVKGVTSIRNVLMIEPQEHRADEEIETDIERRFQSDVWLMGRSLDVRVANGVAYLEGTVRSALEKSRATTLAYVLGVTGVNNDGLAVDWSPPTRLRRSAYADPSDGDIARAVRDAMFQDPRVRSFDVRVQVRAGAVTLSGPVGNLAAKRAAEENARHTVGVRTVNNRLQVRPTDEARDETIADRVRQRLRDNPVMDRHDITVSVQNGVVSLSGVVDNPIERQTAEDMAGQVGGVLAVTNRLITNGAQPARTDEELKTSIEDQLWWSPFVDEDHVHVEVQQGIATLTGTVDTPWERNVAEENAREGGARKVTNRLRVASE